MSTNGATTTSPAVSSNNSSALKPAENDTGYDSSKYYKKPASGSSSRPSSPVAPPPPPPEAATLKAPMPVSTKRLSASETSKLLMESDSDSDTLVIDMGAPSQAPKPVAAEAPPKVKEEAKVKEEPKESSKSSPEAASTQKPAKKSDDSKPAGTKIVKYDGSKSSEKASNNSNCDTFDFVEDAMAAMFAGLEDESPKKKKKPESTTPATTPKTQKKMDTSSADKKIPKVKEEPKESEVVAASTQKSAKKADQHSKTEMSKKKASSDAKATPDKKRVSGPSKQVKKEASDDVPKPPVKRKASDEGCSSSSKRKASDHQIVTPDKSSSDKLPYSGKKRGPKPKKQEAPSRRNSKEGVASTSKTASKGRTKKEKELLASQTEQERLLEKHKGPFVRVDGNPDSPRFSNVVNCPSDALTPEEAAKRGAPDFDSRVRVTGFGPAATTSTLSSRYDPRTVDESWTCVFCQKGSHHARMGDLFGPYHVSCDVLKASASPASPNYTRSPVKNSSQDLAIKFILGGDRSKRSKRARHKSAENVKAASNESRAEVWFHEDCVCWCPDVKVVGNVVLGLDEAVAATQRAPCSKCHLRGSTLGCVAKGCRETAHFNCARLQKWTLDDNLFQARCAQHSQK